MNPVKIFFHPALISLVVFLGCGGKGPVKHDPVPTADDEVPVVLMGDFFLSTQEDIDALIARAAGGPFRSNTEGPFSVTGELFIRGESYVTLSGLSNLISVRRLVVIGTNLLTNLSGLQGLTSIGVGGLLVEKNAALTSLNGLQGLTRAGEVRIVDNPVLTTVTGLESLTHVDGRLDIVLNPELTDLDGLKNLTSIDGDLSIQQNDSLPDSLVQAFVSKLAVAGNIVVGKIQD